MNHSEHGDRNVALANEILRTEVGSGVHGTGIEGHDDHDEAGVFIQPQSQIIGLAKPMDHYTWRSQPEGMPSHHGDTDLVMYSLRKFVHLVAKGNPSVMLPLWAPDDSVYIESGLGAELRRLRGAFLAQPLLQRILGFLDSQVKELTGERKRRTNRPALIEQYGYDVKAASHALRLAFQGIELAEHARMTLPMVPAECERVRAMKTGAHATLASALAEIHDARSQLVSIIDEGRSVLPERPDTARISAWMVSAHQRHWASIRP